MANLKHFLLSLGVLGIYLVGLYGWSALADHNPVLPPWRIILVPLLVLMQTLLIGGIALYISALNVFYEDVKFLTAVVLDLLFYAVPIIYFLEQIRYTAVLHEPYRQIAYYAYLLNPMAVIVSCYRWFLLSPQRIPLGFGSAVHITANAGIPWWSLVWCSFVCIAVFIGGYRFFNSRKWRFVEQL
jgi:ABC-type polysaccharide/polyol phosphate export permease